MTELKEDLRLSERTKLDDHDLLIRIEATVGQIMRRLDGFVTRAEVAPLFEREAQCTLKFKDLATKEELKPIKMAVYGLVSLLCSGVITAIVAVSFTHFNSFK